MSVTVQATFDLARRFKDDGKFERARDLLEICLSEKPKLAPVWDQYGRVLYFQKQFHASSLAFQKALALESTPKTHAALAEALARLRRYEEAIHHRKIVLEKDPGNIDILRSQARDMRNARRNRDAIALVDDFEKSKDPNPHLRLQRALAYLMLGDYERGFADYESRFAAENLDWPGIRSPRWNGEDLAGKSLLVVPEQGFGDAILTARFLPELKARGAHVSMYAKQPLQRLFSELEGLDKIIKSESPGTRFDYYAPIFSLPYFLKLEAGQQPPPARMHVPRDSRDRARKLTAPFRDDFRIGIVWTGTDKLGFNAARRIELPEFGRLAAIPGVQLFSLYKGPDIGQLDEHGMRGIVVDACSTDQDFADTAGIIGEMDLLVTCDTGVVHVAASLGKPVWNLMPTESFWFYGFDDMTPWYPSMKIYRQAETGMWAPVFAAIERDLLPLVEQKRQHAAAG